MVRVGGRLVEVEEVLVPGELELRVVDRVVGLLVPVLDELNRSIIINSFYTNPPFWLKPGQNLRMQVQVSTQVPLIYIPIKAIQYEGDQAAVFVKIDENKYDKRTVRLDRLTGEFAIVKDGLEAGNRVAVTQVFALKALSKYGEFAEE